jgi:hypothetical protein
VAASLSFALALVACGGGGDDNNNLTTNTDFNLQAGVANMVAHGLNANVSLSGTANGTPFNGSGTYSRAVGANAMFNGGAALSQTESISGTVTAAGQAIPLSVSVTDFFATGNSAFLGENDGTEFDVAQAPITYPTSVVGGSGGALGTVSRYTDSTMSVSLGTAQLSYAVDSSNPAKVTLTTKIYDTQNALQETDTTVYSLNTSSVIAFVSASAQTSAGTLTVTAQ